MLKHEIDDGDLSIFAGEDKLLFACTKGHYWIVEATQQSVTRGFGEALDFDGGINELVPEFGPHLLEALGEQP